MGGLPLSAIFVWTIYKPSAATRKPASGTPTFLGSAVDANYTLWLATVAATLMAVACLAAALGLYIVDTTMALSGKPPIFRGEIYVRSLEVSALFSAVALVTHLLRRRLEAVRSATIMVALPFRITVLPPGGDPMAKYECSCQVTLALDHEGPIAAMEAKQDTLKQALENAFVVAVTDPVIRFSKAKIEQTLKVAAHHILGDGLSGVVISEVRQRRLMPEEIKRPPANDTPDDPDPDLAQAV